MKLEDVEVQSNRAFEARLRAKICFKREREREPLKGFDWVISYRGGKVRFLF